MTDKRNKPGQPVLSTLLNGECGEVFRFHMHPYGRVRDVTVSSYSEDENGSVSIVRAWGHVPVAKAGEAKKVFKNAGGHTEAVTGRDTHLLLYNPGPEARARLLAMQEHILDEFLYCNTTIVESRVNPLGPASLDSAEQSGDPYDQLGVAQDYEDAKLRQTEDVYDELTKGRRPHIRIEKVAELDENDFHDGDRCACPVCESIRSKCQGCMTLSSHDADHTCQSLDQVPQKTIGDVITGEDADPFKEGDQ